jgi:hypothetical protein
MRFEGRYPRGGMREAALAALAATALALAGCESGLAELIDDLRAGAPTVCKDYCEDKLACEWPAADGAEEERAFSEGVQRCTVECAFDMGKGTYAVRMIEDEEEPELDYFAAVSGDTLGGVLECAMESGAFRCTEGEPNDVHVFGGVVESACEAADECLDGLGVDQHVRWFEATEGGGDCLASGDEWIAADYFNP